MEYKTFIEVIKKGCSFLEADGFVFRELDRNIQYEKHTPTEGFCINFSWTQYSFLLINALGAYKRFNKVEDIIHKVIGSELNDNYTIFESPDDVFFESNIPDSIIYNKQHHLFKITEEVDIYLFIQVVQDFYSKKALSFFAEHKTIHDIENWMAHTPMEKHQDKLISWSNTMMLRKLIILKQASSEEFASLYLRYKEFLFRKKAENESPYVDMCNVFEKLIPYFESE